MAEVSRVRGWINRLMEKPAAVDPRRHAALLAAVAQREAEVRELDDAALTEAARALRKTATAAAAKTDRAGAALDGAADRLADGAKRPKQGKGLDRRSLVELCALGREAARRGLGERPYDVQLIGVAELLQGRVVEMGTGEGKTLVGALAAAGYAMQGRSVHVMSVNDYLARRDAEWMAPVHELLGVTTGWVTQTSEHAERRDAYAADVTYGAVSEIGFDVLRDRLALDADGVVQRAPDVVLVDEADSVLVDEARVPLVMAGNADDEPLDGQIAAVVRTLRPRVHFETDDDERNVWLTERGSGIVEHALGGIDLYSGAHSARLAAVNASLHAHALLRRDVDYIVRDGKVHLVSASRGRVALRQRWPDGLQAAVEAKEGLAQTESGEVLDTISVQGLVMRYRTVCGMTGTASAASEQLREFYELRVAVVPPNKPCVRDDEPARVYATVEERDAALVTTIVDAHATGRPILVGTLDIAQSERLASRLADAGVTAVVLNAKNDAEEAAIIAEAGARGAVTVSTQMAGRGTDIRLGGSGAQTAPAATDDADTDDADTDDVDTDDVDTDDTARAHDDVAELGGLYVVAAGRYPSSRLDDQLRGRAGRQGDPGGSVVFASLTDDLVVQHAVDATPGSTPDDDGRLRDIASRRVVDHAQRVAEGLNLEIHRNTWRYTRLIERQRALVTACRDDVLHGDLAARQLRTRAAERWAELAAEVADDALAAAARSIVLFHLDRRWSDHLAHLSDVRETIHLRAIARETPIDEFHRIAVAEFKDLLDEAFEQSARTLETAKVTDDGVDLDEAGLKRPTSTWTYLVHDNTIGSDGQQILRRLTSGRRRRRDRD